MLRDSKEIYQRCKPGTFTKTKWRPLSPIINHKKIQKPNLILEQTGIAGIEGENTRVIKSRGVPLSLIGFKKNGGDIFFIQSCSLGTHALFVLYTCIFSELSSSRFLDVGYGNHD